MVSDLRDWRRTWSYRQTATEEPDRLHATTPSRTTTSTPNPPTTKAAMTDRDLIRLAATVCTPKELEAFTLAANGMSERAIALALEISRSAVRARLENAHRKIRQATKENAA
jgi:DNA-binding CsgD family transcriptional regulator